MHTPTPVFFTEVRPLFIIDDPTIRDDLLRLAAAACVDPFVACDASGGRKNWRRASLVFLDETAARQCLRARLPRRTGVVLVTAGETPPDHLWELASELTADHVVCLPAAEPWLIDRLSDDAPASSGQTPVIGVIGGRGGAGASVLAAGLGVTAARRGDRPLLLDADALGGGLDVLLGGDSVCGVRWSDLSIPGDYQDTNGLYAAIPRVGELSVLSWDRDDTNAITAESISYVLEMARERADVVVIDLPRYCDDAALAALQSASVVVLVVPGEIGALVAANRLISVIRPHCAELCAVLRGPTPSGIRLADLARALPVPVIAHIPADPNLRAALERGLPPAGNPKSALAKCCGELLDKFTPAGAIRGRFMTPDSPVQRQVDEVRRRLAEAGHSASPAAIAAMVRTNQEGPSNEPDIRRLATALRAEMTGAGPLEALLADSTVTDVLGQWRPRRLGRSRRRLGAY